MAYQPTVLRSSLNAILAAVQAQISTVTGVPLNRVRVVARNKKSPHFEAPQDILLRDRGFTAVEGISDRVDCRINRKLSVTVRTRCELSEADDDQVWATSTTEGNIVAEEDLINALQNFFPADANQNLLTFEPMKVLSGDSRQTEGDGWGEVELLFHLGIELPLDQSWM